jgi:hypothetical protein
MKIPGSRVTGYERKKKREKRCGHYVLTAMPKGQPMFFAWTNFMN